MGPVARSLRRIGAAALLAGGVGLALPAPAGIFSGFKNSLISFALDQISVPDALEIEAEEIQDPEEGFVRLVGVTIADKNGVWMRIGELVVDWNVSRILRGELEINTLRASDVDWTRLPNQEDVEVEVKEGSELDSSLGGIFDWPRSPIDTRIDEMRLEDVFIEAGVLASQSIRFEAEGAAKDEGDEQLVRLDVTRTDDIEGAIDFEYLRTFDANTLKLQLDAKEAAGGIVAEMAGFPNDAASRLLIDANGPLTEWGLVFEAETETVFEARGNALLSTSEPFTVSADFTVQPGPEMAPRLRRVLAPEAKLIVEIVEDEQGVIRVEEAAIRSPELTLAASGFYSRATNAMDLDIDLAAEGGLAETIEGVELGRFTFDGNIEGTTDDLTATGALNLTGLGTEPLDVDDATLEATVTVAGARIGAVLDGRIDGVRLDRLSREQVGTAEIDGEVVYENEVVTLTGFTITSPLLELGASGTVDLATSQADLNYRLASTELGEIARTYEVDASGALKVEGSVAGPLDAPRIAGDAALTDLTYAGTGYGQVTLAHDVTLGEEPQGTVDLTATGSPYGPAEIDTAFVLTTEQQLRLTEMTATALGVTAQGRATVRLDEQLVAGDLDIRAEDLGEAADYLDLPIGGGASGRVELTIQDGRQMADAELSLDGFTGPGVRIGGGQLTLDVDDALGTPKIVARLDGRELTVQGVEISSVEGRFATREDENVADLAFSLLNIEGAGARVPTAHIEGTVSDPLGAPAVDLDISVEEIEGEEIAGRNLVGAIESTPGPGRIEIDLTADALRAFGAETERAVIDATVDDIDVEGGMTIAADLALDGLAYQGTRLGRFEGRVETTEALEAVRIDARLTGVTGEEGLSVSTARIDGVIRDPFGKPEADADLLVEDLVYQEHRIGRLEGRVETPEEEERIDLDITMTDFALAGVAGDRAVLDGSVRDPFSDLPKIDAELAVDGLAYQDVRLGRLEGTADSSEDGQTVALDVSLSGVEREGLTVDAARVTGTVTDPLGQPAVDADLTVRDLVYQDIALEELSGRVRTTPEKDRITLDVTLRALDGQGVRLDRAEIDGEVLDPFDEPKPTAQILVEGLAYGGDEIGTLRGNVETTTTAEGVPQIELDIRLDGAETGTGAARAEIDATIRDPYGQPLIDADVDIASLRFGELIRIGRMDGRVETSGDGAAVEVDLDLSDIEGAGVRVGTAAVDGTVTDPFGDPAIRADVKAQTVALGDQLRLDSLDGTILSLDGLRRIDVDASASGFEGFGVRFATADVDGILIDPLGEPGFEGEIAAESFAYQDELGIGQIAGTVFAEPGLEAVEIDAGFRDLRGYGLTIAAGQVNGVITDPTGEIGFEGEIGIEQLRYGEDATIGRLSGVVDASPGLALVDLDLNISDLDAFGARVASGDVTGTLIDPTGTIRFDGQVRARQVAYQDYRIGQLSADVDASEGGDRIEVAARLSGASGGGLRLVSAELDAVVENALTEPVLRAELDARNLGFQGNDVQRLQAQATVTSLTGSPAVEGTATASGIRAAGAEIAALELSYDLADVAGTPTGSVRGVARSLAIGGIQAARGDLAADLTEPGGRTRVVADLDLTDVDIGLATIESLDVDATVDDALGAAPVLSVKAESSAADLGFARLTGGLFSADGPLSALNLALSTQGERVLYGEATVPLTFEATARLDLRRGLAGQLSTAALTLGDDRIALNRALTLSAAGGATRLSEIDLAIPGGAITGDLAIHPGGLVGDILLVVTDPRPLARLGELPEATGTIRLAAEFDTRPGSARAVVALDGTDLRFDTFYGEDYGALGLDLDMTWDGRSAALSLNVTGPFDQPVRARLQLPLRPTGGLIPSVPANASIDGALTWQGDIGTLWPLVPLADHVLDGPLAVDLRISGPISGPQVTGRIQMTNGRYENLELGTILTDVNITSDVRSTEAFTVSLTARDAASSTVSGQVTIGAAGIDARINARDAILVRRDDVTAALSLAVTATGPLDSPTIAGDIVIDRAEVRLVNLTPPTVQTLGEVRIKGDRPAPPRRPAGGAITLDLSVRADNDIFIRGRGLDSEWQAALAIDGTASEPRISGEIERLRGELTLLGRDFELSEGEIDFNGLHPINPRLNVRLVRDSDDVVGGIWVHGTASDIEIEFFSQPVLPQDEVLPRVLFGRSKQSLSAIEAVQLAAGVATLLDGTGGALDNIRSSLGVDVLRVDSEGDTASVTVGRNVADDVFVGVKQPIGGGQASVEVEIEIFDNFQVESEVGGEKGSSVGLQWKKDF